MPPYVGMARKQNGGYNASISVHTLIFHLVVNSTRLKTVRSALWRCPNSTVALRLLENVVKVTNLEVVKIEFPIEVLRMGYISDIFRIFPSGSSHVRGQQCTVAIEEKRFSHR